MAPGNPPRLQTRLVCALAHLDQNSPEPNWSLRDASEEFDDLRALVRDLKLSITNLDKLPPAHFIWAVEVYVLALRKADPWKARLKPFLAQLAQHKLARLRLAVLVEAGGNPDWMAAMMKQHVRDLKNAPLSSGLGQPAPGHLVPPKKVLRKIRTQASKLLDRFSSLADDYELFQEALLRPDPTRQKAVQVLRQEGDWLQEKFGPKSRLGSLLAPTTWPDAAEHQLALRLSSHMALTTGKYYDEEVAKLVSVLRTKGSRQVTAGSVEQLRRRTHECERNLVGN